MKELTFRDMVLRLAQSMLCGGVVGYGRSRKQRPAGLRTYMLVCLGAASAVLISLYLYEMMPEPLTEHISHMAGVVSVAAL